MQNTYSEILANVKTVDEAENLVFDIENYISNSFKLDTSNEMKWATLSLINKYITNDEKLDQEFLKGLIEALQKAPLVKIETAFEPRVSTIEAVSKWVKTKVGSETLIEVKKKSELLLGATVSFDGKYVDLTLKKFLDKRNLSL